MRFNYRVQKVRRALSDTVGIVLGIVFSVSFLLLSGCGDALPEHLMDQRAYDVIANADRVESFAIDPEMLGPGDERGTRVRQGSGVAVDNYIDYFEVTAVGPELSSNQVLRLQNLLLSGSSYLDPKKGSKLCIFVPHHALVFHHGDTVLNVLVCFQCAQIMFMNDEAFLGAGDFDPIEAELRTLVRELLPVEG